MRRRSFSSPHVRKVKDQRFINAMAKWPSDGPCHNAYLSASESVKTVKVQVAAVATLLNQKPQSGGSRKEQLSDDEDVDEWTGDDSDRESANDSSEAISNISHCKQLGVLVRDRVNDLAPVDFQCPSFGDCPSNIAHRVRTESCPTINLAKRTCWGCHHARRRWNWQD